MGDSLEVGIESVAEFEVEGALLTDVGGTLAREVLSTPGMIDDDGADRVDASSTRCWGRARRRSGSRSASSTSRAHRRESRCTARARLEEIVDGRKLRFAVEVVGSDGRTIGVGTHERRVIDVEGAA